MLDLREEASCGDSISAVSPLVRVVLKMPRQEPSLFDACSRALSKWWAERRSLGCKCGVGGSQSRSRVLWEATTTHTPLCLSAVQSTA